MTLISEVLRAVNAFKQATFQSDPFALYEGPRATVFFKDDRTAKMVEIFLNNAQKDIPPDFHYWIEQSGLQVSLIQHEKDHSQRINHPFAQGIQKGVDAFKAFLLSPWEKCASENPRKVCYSKTSGNETEILYRLLSYNTIHVDWKDKTNIIAGTEEDVTTFMQTLSEEMRPSSSKEEKKLDSPRESEGFKIVRCAKDVIPFSKETVAYKTALAKDLLFGQIPSFPLNWTNGQRGFQLRKLELLSKGPEAVTGLTNSYFKHPIFMRLATLEEVAEMDRMVHSGEARWDGLLA